MTRRRWKPESALALATLFGSIVAASACGGASSETASDGGSDVAVDSCSTACACYKPPPPRKEVVPYPNQCGDAGAADAGDGGDAADSGDAADAACDPYPDPPNCALHCPGDFTLGRPASDCKAITGDAGQKLIECTYMPPPCGRRPAWLAEAEPTSASTPEDWLAEAARLEAASIDAFEILASELEAHGAPLRLVRGARVAARDEVRHARAMSALARRRGRAVVAPSRGVRRAPRSLEAIALENAVEGCVRETYGALLATHQGAAARDRAVRRAMKRIAADETRHAALSWSIAKWIERRLDAEARARVAEARRRAAEALLRDVESPPPRTLIEALGLPSGDAARDLAGRLAAALW